MQRSLAAILATTAVTAAQLTGARSSPTPGHPRTAFWYWRLSKPAFTPPGPVFGAAWTALDALLGYTGYRLLTAPRSTMRTTSLSFWGLNIAGVAGFSWVLFGKKRLDAATGVSAAMLATSIGTVAAAAEVDRKAAIAGIPLIGWVAFATLLQADVWRRNR